MTENFKLMVHFRRNGTEIFEGLRKKSACNDLQESHTPFFLLFWFGFFVCFVLFVCLFVFLN